MTASTTIQYRKFVSIALALLTLIATGATLAGVEKKLFAPRLDSDRLIESKLDHIQDSADAAANLQSKMAAHNLNGKFVWTEELPTEPERTEPVDELAGKDFLFFTGVITLPNGSKRVLMNGTYLSEGSSILGCRIQAIHDKTIDTVVDGQLVAVPLYEKYYFQPSGLADLTLERIIELNGRWTAFFQGNAYNVGDWVDSQTIIQIITPTRVQVKRDDEQIILSAPNAKQE